MAIQSLATISDAQLLSAEELAARLRRVGEERYHHQHPFHLMMHEGKLSRGQMQAWALNRYYYQSRIPIKDAIILSRSEDPDFRRAWRKRVVDHDGDSAQEGGIERWIRLAEATGLDRQRVMGCDEVLPAVRYAVDAYLDLVKNRTFLEAVASSLTELFSRDLIACAWIVCGSIIPGCRVGSTISPHACIRRRKTRDLPCNGLPSTRARDPNRSWQLRRYGPSAIFSGRNWTRFILPTSSRDGLRRAHSAWSPERASSRVDQPAPPCPRLPMEHPGRTTSGAFPGRHDQGAGDGPKHS